MSALHKISHDENRTDLFGSHSFTYPFRFSPGGFGFLEGYLLSYF